MTRWSWRMSVLAGAVAVLTLAGGGGAAAYWSAQAQVEATAAAASTGLVQTVQSTPLTVTYSSSLRVAAGAVTVQNTGSRGAAYSLSLSAASATSAGLPGAITVAAAVVASAAACTTTATLSGAQTGTASSFTATGTVAAGASVVVCLQTSMTAADVTTYGGASASLSVRTGLEYAAADAWRVSGAAVTFTQQVAQSQFVPDGTAMTCNDNNGWNLDLWFTEATPTSGISYRFFLARESTPTTRVAYSPATDPNPWWTAVQVAPGNASLQSYLSSANGAMGNTWLFVERSTAGSGGPWTQIAYGKFRTATLAEGLRTWCGWQ
ncbi:hypothetical protein [Microbacterium sp.]|uniref:hypothetical protein n=1 Tax=Microbacterium sp. TaxID=51671 RepID=UPI0039E45F5C